MHVARFSMIDRIPDQVHHMNQLLRVSEADCIAHLCMDRNAFGRSTMFTFEKLRGLIRRRIGLSSSFLRHGETVSHYIHLVLKAILKIHNVLLARPVPVPNDSKNPRWKWFKVYSFMGCLGALDETYINVHVSVDEKGRYRTRKGGISTNVLVVCDREMHFVYLLPGYFDCT
ncbi:hypothetical protein ACS0TY_035429 [Phlomoides rotata]